MGKKLKNNNNSFGPPPKRAESSGDHISKDGDHISKDGEAQNFFTVHFIKNIYILKIVGNVFSISHLHKNRSISLVKNFFSIFFLEIVNIFSLGCFCPMKARPGRKILHSVHSNFWCMHSTFRKKN